MSLISDFYPIGEKASRKRESKIDLTSRKKKASLVGEFFPTTEILPPPKLSLGERIKKTVKDVSQRFTSFGTSLKSFFEKAEPVISEGLRSIFANNETIIQKAEIDLIQKIDLKISQGKDTREENRQLGLVRLAQDPNIDEVKKKVIVDYLRFERGLTQIGSGLAGFGASILDTLTQFGEVGLEEDIRMSKRLLEKEPGNIHFQKQLSFFEDSKIKFDKEGFPTRKLSDKVKKWSQETAVSNPDFVEKVIQGSGSMIGFILASYASGGGTVPFLLESFTEAGSVYETNRNQGKNIEESSKKADVALVFNLILNKVLNVFDVKPGQLKNIKTVLRNTRDEGMQEGGQQIISNLTTGRPWEEGVLESVGIGAALGGATTFVLPSGETVQLSPKIDEDVEKAKITKITVPKTKEGVDVEKISVSIIKIKNQRVFRGAEGVVSSEKKTFDKVLSVETNQFDLMKMLAEQGNVAAQEHIDSIPEGVERVDFSISDPIIREEFSDRFDAIEYKNEQLPQIGREFHELSTNRFFAENKETAEQYALQNRGAKFEKLTKKVIKRSVSIVDGKKVFKKEVVEVPIEEDVVPKVKKITEEQRIKNVLEADKKRIKNLRVATEFQKSKMLKALGFEVTALKRGISREPTPITIDRTRKFLNSIHADRPVIVKGDIGLATGKVSFGKHEIKFEDGSIKFVERRDIKIDEITRKDILDHIKNEAIKDLESREERLGIKLEVEKPTKKVIKRFVEVVDDKKTVVKVSDKKVVKKEPISTAKAITERKIAAIKDEKAVKSTLRDIRKELRAAVIEAEGLAILAVEQRAGLDTDNVAKLKRIVALNKKFQEGDIETIRKSKSRDLVNTVVENVQEVHPNMSEQEAFDFALNLPTKVQEKGRPSSLIILEKKEKKLSKFLDQLREKQKELEIEEDEALSNEWLRALSVQEELISIIRVPKTQLPVGEGVEKISRLEARISGKLEGFTQSEQEKLGLSTFRQMNRKANKAKAAKYVAENPEDALRVIKGEIDPPEGVLTNSVFVALNELGAGDTDIAVKVATLGSTRFGQEISILAEIDKDSPVSMMRDIIKTRVEGFEKRIGRKSRAKIKSEIKKIDSEIKAPNARQWDAFLKEVLC